MRLLLRADASASLGVGHAMRAFSLAESARALGHSVLFAGSVDDVQWLAALVREAVDVVEAPSYADLGSWAAAENVDVVFVDDYEAPVNLWMGCDRAGVLLGNVEDGRWGRRRADFVVDPSLGAHVEARPADGSGVVLCGLEYAWVRAAVRRARRGAVARDASETNIEVLAVMGGTDAARALPRVLAALAEAQAGMPDLRVRVRAVGHDVKERSVPGLDVVPLTVGPELPVWMAASDLVVTAAGTTMLELCCIGAPMAVVAVTANQLAGYEAFTDAGLAVGLGTPGRVGVADGAASLLAGVLASPARRAELARRVVARVDGAGGARLLRVVERRVNGAPTAPAGLVARPATFADAPALLSWRNDPVVRSASRTREVIEPAAHEVWLSATLDAPWRHLYLVEDAAAQAVGSVRWDRIEDSADWEVSISLATYARGRGWGGAVLAVAESAFRATVPEVKRLLATVHADNKASLRLFLGSGYAHTGSPDEEGFLRLTKELRAAVSR